jgi:hypothetical protein
MLQVIDAIAAAWSALRDQEERHKASLSLEAASGKRVRSLENG